MKRFLHPLIFLLLLSANSFAQTELFSDNFETYTADQRLAEQSSYTEWTTWSATPGSAEDPFVSTEQASEGTKSVKVASGNDLVLDLGSKTTGRYQVTFDMYVSNTHSGFFGFMEDFAGNDTEFGLSIYFKSNGAEISAGGKDYEKAYSYDTWFNVNVIIDLDDDFATLYFDDSEIISWEWSGNLDGIDFWGYDQTGSTSLYYLDDIKYNQLTVPSAPSNLQSSLTDKTVSLTWDAPASGSPDKYAIVRNGKLIESTPNTNFDDNTLIYPMEYTYSVKAHYAGLGYSSSSNETSQTITGASSQRCVLIEHFTNASCGPCASQNPVLDELLNTGDNYSKVAHIGYHTSWPGTDPMYDFNEDNNMGDARVTYYNVSGVPNAVISGNMFQGGPASITQELIDEEYTRPGLFNVTASIEVDEKDSVFIDIEYTSLADFNSGSFKVHTVLTEHLDYASAPGQNGEKVFPEVMRYMYPDKNGKPISAPSVDEVITVSYKAKLDDVIGDDLQLVTFIQDDDDKEVYMAYQIREDFTSPSIKFTPADGSTNVLTTSNVSITFSEPIRMSDDSEITDPASYIIFKKDNKEGEDVPVTGTINTIKKVISLDPVNELDGNQVYYVEVEKAVFENYSGTPNFADSIKFTTSSGVGINDLGENINVSLYPNPCSEKLNLEFYLEDETSVKVRIYNEVGKLVKLVDKGRLYAGNNKFDINLNRFSNGLYFVKIEAGTKSITQQIQILK